jgi:predicted PurR-regulated permease PerM
MSFANEIFAFLTGWFGFFGLLIGVPILAVVVVFYFRPRTFERLPSDKSWYDRFWRRPD